MTDKLFVYGTLKPGQSRWPLLAPHVRADCATSDELPGCLYATPYGWPAATFAAGTDRVPGVVLTLKAAQVQPALQLLDEVEGVAAGLFARRELCTLRDSRVFAYEWAGPVEGFTAVRTWP